MTSSHLALFRYCFLWIFSAYLLFATSHLRILRFIFQTARIKCQAQVSTFVNPELASWKCYPPPTLYLPSWNQRLPVSCYAHLCELGHVLQSASCTKENIPDPCPGARVIARNSWKYPHCTELKCLQGDMWHERPYFQSMVITGVVVVDHLFIPKSILHLTSEMHWLGSYYTEAVCANPAKYFRKKKPNWSLNFKA